MYQVNNFTAIKKGDIFVKLENKGNEGPDKLIK